jgi:hypothetical protein
MLRSNIFKQNLAYVTIYLIISSIAYSIINYFLNKVSGGAGDGGVSGRFSGSVYGGYGLGDS